MMMANVRHRYHPVLHVQKNGSRWFLQLVGFVVVLCGMAASSLSVGAAQRLGSNNNNDHDPFSTTTTMTLLLQSKVSRAKDHVVDIDRIETKESKFRIGRRAPTSEDSGKYRQYGNVNDCSNVAFVGRSIPCRDTSIDITTGLINLPGRYNKLVFTVYVGLPPETRSIAQIVAFYMTNFFNCTLENVDIYMRDVKGISKEGQQVMTKTIQQLYESFQEQGGINRSPGIHAPGGDSVSNLPDEPKKEDEEPKKVDTTGDHNISFRGDDGGDTGTRLPDDPPTKDDTATRLTDDPPKTDDDTGIDSPRGNDGGGEGSGGDGKDGIVVITVDPTVGRGRDDDIGSLTTTLPGGRGSSLAISTGTVAKTSPTEPYVTTGGEKVRHLNRVGTSYFTNDERIDDTFIIHQGAGRDLEQSQRMIDLYYMFTVTELEDQWDDMWMWRYDIYYSVYWKLTQTPMNDFKYICSDMLLIAEQMESEIREALAKYVLVDLYLDFSHEKGLLPLNPPDRSPNKNNTGEDGPRPIPPTPAPEMSTTLSPKSFDEDNWEWQRYAGVGLLVFTVSMLATLISLSVLRKNRESKREAWLNLGREDGVEKLLATGWVLKGSQMVLFDKSKYGYSDDDSIFFGGFEQRDKVIGSEIAAVTFPESCTVSTPDTHSAATPGAHTAQWEDPSNFEK